MKATIQVGEAVLVRVVLAGSGAVDVILSEAIGPGGLGVLTVGVGGNPPVVAIAATGEPGKVGVKVLEVEKKDPPQKAQKTQGKGKPGVAGKHPLASLEGGTKKTRKGAR